MGYGSGFYYPSPLNPSDFASGTLYKKPEKSFIEKHVGLFRIFIVIVEVGLSMAAGVLTGGLATAAQVGIGLAAASANTALSAATGRLTGIGVGIDFATAFIPGATGLARAGRTARALKSVRAENLQSIVKNAARSQSERLVEGEFASGLATARKYATQATRLENQAIKKSADLSRRVLSGQLSDTEKAALEISTMTSDQFNFSVRELEQINIADLSQEAANSALIAQNKIAQALKKYRVSLQQVEDEILELEKTFKAIENMPLVKRMSKHEFLNEVVRLSPKDKQGILKALYNDVLKTTATRKVNQKVLAAETTISTAETKLSDQGKKYYRIFVDKWKFIPTTAKNIERETDALVKLLSTSDVKILQRIFRNETTGLTSLSDSFQVLARGGQFGNAMERGTWRGFIKGLGTRKFNENFVQWAQNIDPNDLGRFFTEKLYQKFRDKYEKKIYQRYFDKALNQATKNINETTDLTKAAKKAGIKALKSRASKGLKGEITPIISRYISGIKKLPMGTALKRSVLVIFNKATTSGLTGKNIGGKHDIIVTMSDYDFERLAEEGTSYWFAVGKKKGWFVSRGGRRVTARNSRVISNNLSLFLGFVPVPALRNVLSIVSNWVEVVSDVARGTYHKNYWPTFERSIIHSLLNRPARLLTKVIIGNAYKGYKVGKATRIATKEAMSSGHALGSKGFKELVSAAAQKAGRKSAWLGRELQRVSTTTLSTFYGKNQDGTFKFKTSGDFRKRSMGATLLRKYTNAAIPTSVRSAMIRKERYTSGPSYGRQLVNAKRYLGQVGRIYSATTPNGTIPSLRKITKFK